MLLYVYQKEQCLEQIWDGLKLLNLVCSCKNNNYKQIFGKHSQTLLGQLCHRTFPNHDLQTMQTAAAIFEASKKNEHWAKSKRTVFFFSKVALADLLLRSGTTVRFWAPKNGVSLMFPVCLNHLLGWNLGQKTKRKRAGPSICSACFFLAYCSTSTRVTSWVSCVIDGLFVFCFLVCLVFLGRWCSFHNVLDFLKTSLSPAELLGCRLSFRTKLEGNFYFGRRFPNSPVCQKLFEKWLQLQLEGWLIVGGRAHWVLKMAKMCFC